MMQMKTNLSYLLLSFQGIRCKSDYIQEEEKEELSENQGPPAGKTLVYTLKSTGVVFFPPCN